MSIATALPGSRRSKVILQDADGREARKLADQSGLACVEI